MKILKKLLFLSAKASIFASNEHSTMGTLHCHKMPVLVIFLDFRPNWPNMVIWPQTPRKMKFFEKKKFISKSIKFRFQRALNHDMGTSYCHKIPVLVDFLEFWPKWPNMVIWPQTPEKWKFLKISFFISKSIKFRFQRALNQPEG